VATVVGHATWRTRLLRVSATKTVFAFIHPRP